MKSLRTLPRSVSHTCIAVALLAGVSLSEGCATSQPQRNVSASAVELILHDVTRNEAEGYVDGLKARGEYRSVELKMLAPSIARIVAKPRNGKETASATKPAPTTPSTLATSTVRKTGKE